jgi:hypothetical protein
VGFADVEAEYRRQKQMEIDGGRWLWGVCMRVVKWGMGVFVILWAVVSLIGMAVPAQLSHGVSCAKQAERHAR